MPKAISQTASPIQIRAMISVEGGSMVGRAGAEFADFSQVFTGDILGATEMPETGKSESNQNASRSMREPPWPTNFSMLTGRAYFIDQRIAR